MKARKTADGFVFIDPETVKALLSIRENIERGEVHQGKNKEIAQAAFNEIQAGYGNHPRRFEGCSGCWVEGNKLLNNWLRMYDQRGKIEQIRLNPPTVKKLQPIKEKKNKLQPKKEKEIKTDKEMVDLSKLTLEELQLECKRRCIKYHHKNKKPKLIQLLSE